MWRQWHPTSEDTSAPFQGHPSYGSSIAWQSEPRKSLQWWKKFVRLRIFKRKKKIRHLKKKNDLFITTISLTCFCRWLIFQDMFSLYLRCVKKPRHLWENNNKIHPNTNKFIIPLQKISHKHTQNKITTLYTNENYAFPKPQSHTDSPKHIEANNRCRGHDTWHLRMPMNFLHFLLSQVKE